MVKSEHIRTIVMQNYDNLVKAIPTKNQKATGVSAAQF